MPIVLKTHRKALAGHFDAAPRPEGPRGRLADGDGLRRKPRLRALATRPVWSAGHSRLWRR